MADNFLRVDNKPGGDTRRMVREVLAFMADSFYATEDRTKIGLPTDGASLGAGHILGMCMDALKEAESEEAAP